MPAAIHENILNADHHNSGLVGFAQGGRLRQTLVHSLRSFQHGLLQFGGLRNLGETLCGGGGKNRCRDPGGKRKTLPRIRVAGLPGDFR